jgi:hypothetical protein
VQSVPNVASDLFGEGRQVSTARTDEDARIGLGMFELHRGGIWFYNYILSRHILLVLSVAALADVRAKERLWR